MVNSPGPQGSRLEPELMVDFTNQTSISNSKCYTDLETAGRAERTRLTLFLPERPLQIPVAPRRLPK